MITNHGKESSFNEGDTVEVLTGDYQLLCGDACKDDEGCDKPLGDAEGVFTVETVEYEFGEFYYKLVDGKKNAVWDVREEDLWRVGATKS